MLRVESVVEGEGKLMPLRGVPAGIDTVRRILDGKLNPELVLFTMRVSGQTYLLTLADLRLVQGE